MDDWKIIVGGATITIFALYFSDRYIESMSHQPQNKDNTNNNNSNNSNNFTTSSAANFFRSKLNSFIQPKCLVDYQAPNEQLSFILQSHTMQQVVKLLKRSQLSQFQRHYASPDPTSPSSNNTGLISSMSSQPVQSPPGQIPASTSNTPTVTSYTNTGTTKITTTTQPQPTSSRFFGGSISSFFNAVSTQATQTVQNTLQPQTVLDDAYTGLVLDITNHLNAVPLQQFELFLAELDKVFQLTPQMNHFFGPFDKVFGDKKVEQDEQNKQEEENDIEKTFILTESLENYFLQYFPTTIPCGTTKPNQEVPQQQEKQQEEQNTTKNDNTNNIDNNQSTDPTTNPTTTTDPTPLPDLTIATSTPSLLTNSLPPTTATPRTITNLSALHSTNTNNAQNFPIIEAQEQFLLATAHKLYLLTMRLDNNPDEKLQAYYDLYTDYQQNADSLSQFDVDDDENARNSLGGDDFVFISNAQQGAHHSNQQQQQKKNNNKDKENNNKTQFYAQINSDDDDAIDDINNVDDYDDDLGAATQKKTQTNNNNKTNTNKNINNNSDPTQQAPPQHQPDQQQKQLQKTALTIQYPQVFSIIQQLHQILSLALFFENLMKIRITHDDVLHEQLLKLLWEYAPLFVKEKVVKKKKEEVATEKSEQTETTPTTPESPQQQEPPSPTPQPVITKPDYQQKHVLWSDIGFQGSDPVTDFRGGGLLALLVLSTFCLLYPHDYHLYIKAHQERGINIYGLAITSINITSKLVELMREQALSPLFIQHGINFFTFAKCHRYVLSLLYNEWMRREEISTTNNQQQQQQQRTVGSMNSAAQGANYSNHQQQHQQPTMHFQAGRLTIMDFPIVFKEVLDLFKQQIIAGEVEFDEE